MRYQKMVVAFALIAGAAVAQQGEVKWLSRLPVSSKARITVEVVPPTSKVGEKVNLKLTFKNVSDSPLPYVAEGAAMAYEVAMFHEDGAAVPRPKDRIWASGGSAWRKTLAPGEEVEDTLYLSWDFDLKRKGKYYLRVWRLVTSPQRDSPPEAAVSGVVTFVVSD